MSDGSLDREIEAMVRNPRVAKAVKESLERLKAGHAGPEMAEMASGVLDGSIKLRDLAKSSVYSEGFLVGLERYKQWEATLSSDERQRLQDEAESLYGRDLGRPERG
ncbi:hypothetical protein QLQ12_06125 [Actinoplanes sp. NEAU-A12]|uniref:Uncharacterized protein n=1 Tax=Actinoplanes sandaracinus TaxID=3045177 RepID=A0ABT6WEN1_9ACTN|nr:hypothetical protein [Actinoplanes sandaracinus]MDI6098179.1 hypothetical protein [Actinoplanes sandaracinus]